MKYFIGVDLGTSGLKALLVSEKGEIICAANSAYPCDFPNPGWSEQSPSVWWDALVTAVKKLTGACNKTEIAGIGVAGQMHGLVTLDQANEVIRPCILWNDGRSEKQTAFLNEKIGKDKLKAWTGNVAFPGFTAPKVLWMKENEEENFAKIRKILLPKDYLNFRLTGNFTTDLSDAAGMLFLDVKNGCWSKEMCDICGITEETLPQLLKGYETAGYLTEGAAEALGLPQGIPVAAGAGDNAGAAIGTLLPEKDRANISLGTSGTVFLPCENFLEVAEDGIHNFRHADGNYHLMACILSAASCNEWFCKDILQTEDYAGEQSKITAADLGNNHVFFLPYLMGERSPMNDVNARGVFFGLRRDTKREDMTLAVLEGVAFALKENLEIMKGCGIEINRCTLCGGGAKSHLWQSVLANVLRLPMDLPVCEEGPSYGVAILAMVSAGAYASVSEATEKFLKTKESVLPDSKISDRYEEKYQQFKKIYPALKNVF